MDTLLKTKNAIEFFLISPESPWWEKLIEAGLKANLEYVPPLSERMPIPALFNRFRNGHSFTIAAVLSETFAGCFCCYLRHPVLHVPAIQFILVAEDFRGKKLTDTLFALAFEQFEKRGHYDIKSCTWSTNLKSRRMFERNGFTVKDELKDDRGPGIHTLIYEKTLAAGCIKDTLTPAAAVSFG